MLNLILQKLVPLLTTFALFINSIGGLFGVSAVIPYNPERTDAVVSGEISTDTAEILEYYNSAIKETGFVIGKTTSDIIGTPSASTDDLDIDMTPYWDAIGETETYLFEVPGDGNVIAADVKSAKMSVNDGKRTVILEIKDVKRTEKTDDAVARAYGWSTDLNEIFSSSGIGITVEGGEFKESYTDCTISCIIDEKTGKIIYGDWDATGTISMKDVTVKAFGLEFTMDMDYTARQYIDI